MTAIDISLLKAKKVLKQGDVQEAQNILEKVLRVYPNNPRIKNFLENLNVYSDEPKSSSFPKKDDKKINNYDPYETQAVNEVIFLYQQNLIQEAFNKASDLLQKFNKNEKLLVTMGCLYKEKNDYKNAQKYFDLALKLNPNSIEARLNKGAALSDVGYIDDSIQVYKDILKIEPNSYNAYGNLGCSYASLGAYEEAIECFKNGLRISPNNAVIFTNMGYSFQQAKNLQEAHRCFFRAIEIDPTYLPAFINHGILYLKTGDYENSLICLKKALNIDQNSVEAILNYASLLSDIGEFTEAEYYINKALKINPNKNTAISNLLLMSNYSSNNSKENVFEIHKKFGTFLEKSFGEGYSEKLIENKSKNQKINVGFVSADLHQHSVTYFLEPLLKNYNKDEFVITCFNASFHNDHVTKRIKSSVDKWFNVGSASNTQLYNLIKQNDIEILVDLSGHTDGNRLPVFAMKPSPIQITWLGYPNTTGLNKIDYRIVDNFTDPEGVDDHLYTEKLLRLENSFICFSSEEDAEINKNTIFEDNSFTFGSFNNLSKMSDEVIECWSEILKRIDNSKIILKNKQLRSNFTRKIYLEKFAKYGVSSDKIVLMSWSNSRKQHLETYNSIDLALDTFPYNGTTTTFEALWMNVPVLCLNGDSHRSRVGYSILKNLDFNEFIVNSRKEYIEKAVHYSVNKIKMNKLTDGLRSKLIKSNLCDSKAYTKKFENLLKSLTR